MSNFFGVTSNLLLFFKQLYKNHIGSFRIGSGFRTTFLAYKNIQYLFLTDQDHGYIVHIGAGCTGFDETVAMLQGMVGIILRQRICNGNSAG